MKIILVVFVAVALAQTTSWHTFTVYSDANCATSPLEITGVLTQTPCVPFDCTLGPTHFFIVGNCSATPPTKPSRYVQSTVYATTDCTGSVTEEFIVEESLFHA